MNKKIIIVFAVLLIISGIFFIIKTEQPSKNEFHGKIKNNAKNDDIKKMINNNSPDKKLITKQEIYNCQKDEDCAVVPYRSCCGAAKTAINKKYLDEYNKHPEWQSFNDKYICARIGVCPPDGNIKDAYCNSNKKCKLKY